MNKVPRLLEDFRDFSLTNLTHLKLLSQFFFALHKISFASALYILFFFFRSRSDFLFLSKTFVQKGYDFILGKDDDLHSTSTVIIMERLQVGDRIYTKMDLDEGGEGASLLHSQKVNPSIHFVGQRISN